ncbi:hypothetical protein NDU88_007613 [Pleurodeles waltl]|uniref:Uncharacterized protein n=1 Tax=Pleurodeles waltl TaxID=8319 RepID=A0AAV7N2J3_PLEWA|nr:hypothetical protein NDU88_007613 [Pleurodeles waltl]
MTGAATVPGFEYQSPSRKCEPPSIGSQPRSCSSQSGNRDLTERHAPPPLNAAQAAQAVQAAARKGLLRCRSVAQSRRSLRRGPSCPSSNRQRWDTHLPITSAAPTKRVSIHPQRCLRMHSPGPAHASSAGCSASALIAPQVRRLLCLLSHPTTVWDPLGWPRGDRVCSNLPGEPEIAWTQSSKLWCCSGRHLGHTLTH